MAADLALQLADLRVRHANLLAACRAAVAAERDGETDPVSYLRDQLDEHGQMPAVDQHPAQILALCPCAELGAAS